MKYRIFIYKCDTTGFYEVGMSRDPSIAVVEIGVVYWESEWLPLDDALPLQSRLLAQDQEERRAFIVAQVQPQSRGSWWRRVLHALRRRATGLP